MRTVLTEWALYSTELNGFMHIATYWRVGDAPVKRWATRDAAERNLPSSDDEVVYGVGESYATATPRKFDPAKVVVVAVVVTLDVLLPVAAHLLDDRIT